MTLPSDSGTNVGIAGLGGKGTDVADSPMTFVENGYVFQKVPRLDFFGKVIPGEFDVERVGPAKEGSSGSGRNDALSSAQAALSGFLQAQSLADARKMSAMENFFKLSQFAVPEGAQFAPGSEPGGLASTAHAVAGQKKYTPIPLQTRRMNPNDVAGEIPPEIRQMIGAVRSAGGG